MSGTQPSQTFVREPISAGYSPRPRVFGLWSDPADNRPWFRLMDVEVMRRDPQIRLGLRVLRAPVRRARWKVTASSPEVANFVDNQLKFVWKRCLGRMLAMLEYGYAAGEWDYTIRNNVLVIRDLLDFYALDADPLVLRNKIVGLQLEADNRIVQIGTPRSFWLINEPEYDRYRGLSRLANAWSPWKEKTGRNGALDSRRLWFFKNATRGDQMRFPMGTSTLEDGTVVNNEDLAREIVEKIQNGGILALPNFWNEPAGDYQWTIDGPEASSAAVDIREYPKDLDLEMLKGMGVPPEVIQASGESGSGYAGRSVPAQAFYTSEDDIVVTVVDTVDRSAIFPMVRANYGPGAWYDVEVLPLLQDAPEAESNGSQRPGGRPGESQSGDPGGGIQMSMAQRVAAQAARRFPDVVSLSFNQDQPRDNHGRFATTGAKIGTVHHGGRVSIDAIDPARLQSRDEGAFGKGFYTTREEKTAKGYGPVVSSFDLKPDARVLQIPDRPENAHPELRRQIHDWAIKAGYKIAPDDDPIAAAQWGAMAGEFAEAHGYDALHIPDGQYGEEIVIKNHDAVKARKPIALSLADDQPRHDDGRFKSHDDEPTPHKFSSTQFNLPDDLAEHVRQLAAALPADDLAADGLEDEPHVTVKYGLHTDNAMDVSAIVRGFGPVRVTLGPLSLFPAKPGDEAGSDVLKIGVSGDDIVRLNGLIATSLECTDTHPTYQPHITVAYLKAGCGTKHVGIHALIGKELTFDRLLFSDHAGEKTPIALASEG